MKVAFHTLGCKVNQYETEAISERFREEGYEIVDESEFADIYIINTCTVTAVADKKSRQFIRKMKKVNPDSVIAVTGCYAQIKPDEIYGIDGVDIVAGTNEKSRLTEYVAEYMKNGREGIYIKDYDDLDEYDDLGIVPGPENRTRAYIKIQEGCNRFCTYCVIPYARGKVRSRPLEDIIEEASRLIGMGFRELVLTGINTALYGMENINIYHNDSDADIIAENGIYGVEEIIAALDSMPGDFRIRLSSLEPSVVNADYVKRLLKYDRLCHHLHLSAQSGSDDVLHAMNRPYDREGYLAIVDALREADPYYGLSTDIIVGFPGEKDADFEDSCSLVEKSSFCKTHVFKYSKRPFTKAAGFRGHISPQIKNSRGERLREEGRRASMRFFEMNAGRTDTVLAEEISVRDSMITGYTDNYIKAYIPFNVREEAERKLNTMIKVRLQKPYNEGMLAVETDDDYNN